MQVAPSAASRPDMTTPADRPSEKKPLASSSAHAVSNTASVPTPASPAPIIRRARQVTADELPATASSVSSPPDQSSRNAAPSSPPVRARIITGPRDIQVDSVRHTAATLSVPPEDFETLRQMVFASFLQQKIAPVPIAASYRIGIALVSLLMVMLPLIYLALIGIAGWGRLVSCQPSQRNHYSGSIFHHWPKLRTCDRFRFPVVPDAHHCWCGTGAVHVQTAVF